MNLPSEELLSKVLGYEVFNVDEGYTASEIHYETNYADTEVSAFVRETRPFKRRANIYELAHKCKEWAYESGYEFSYNRKDMVLIIENMFPSHTTIGHKWIFDTTELEAIFKACQWILDEKSI